MRHQIAQMIADGEEQIIVFPEGFRIDAEEVTIHRIKDGGLLGDLGGVMSIILDRCLVEGDFTA